MCFISEGKKEGMDGDRNEVKENDLCGTYKNEYSTLYMFEVYHYFKNIIHKPCHQCSHIKSIDETMVQWIDTCENKFNNQQVF